MSVKSIQSGEHFNPAAVSTDEVLKTYHYLPLLLSIVARQLQLSSNDSREKSRSMERTKAEYQACIQGSSNSTRWNAKLGLGLSVVQAIGAIAGAPLIVQYKGIKNEETIKQVQAAVQFLFGNTFNSLNEMAKVGSSVDSRQKDAMSQLHLNRLTEESSAKQAASGQNREATELLNAALQAKIQAARSGG